MNHFCSFSGGIGSWAASMRVRQRVQPGDVFRLLFADTFIEDFDLYRFLIEGAAVISGQPTVMVADLAAEAREIPELYRGGIEPRRAAILRLREKAIERLPLLAWIYDGRSPWEVYRDRKFIGNSQRDPCSAVLKRDLMGKWRDENGNPGNTILYFGIDWTEEHRIQKARIAHGFRWDLRAPLCEKPFPIKAELIAELEAFGMEAPRLNRMGFAHNNCGGFCCKAGFSHFRLLHEKLPEVYGYHEEEEQSAGLEIGGGHTVLRKKPKGAPAIPVSLRELREQIEADAATPTDDLAQGCGCAL